MSRRFTQFPTFARVIFATLAIVAAASVLFLSQRNAEAGGAIQGLAGCTANSLERGDDSNFSDAVAMSFTANFFGQSYGSVYVNNNGNVTFDSGLSAFTPENLAGTSRVIIAPFWADVDTRGAASGVVTYGPTTYAGHAAFCVNWINVGYYSANTDKLNSFQLLLVSRTDTGVGDFDIIMNYDKVQWETGDFNGGEGGLGGESARMGYSNGDDVSFEYPGSGVNGAFLDSAATGLSRNSRNSLVGGRYIFEVRNGAPPSGGTITGVVVGPALAQSLDVGAAGSLVPMANALVTACAIPPCLTTNTNANGEFTFTGAPAGSYHVIAYPPPGRNDLLPADAAFDLAQDQEKDLGTLTMSTPLPAPQGFVIQNIGSIGGAPVLNWSVPSSFSIPGCNGGNGTWELRATNGTLLDSGTLTESPPGTYSGTVQPLVPYHGPARLSIHIDCPSGPDEDTSIDVYIDPSGTVKTVGGSPIQGATVTLYRSDSAAGPFDVVPDGSAIMSPSNRTNPDMTDVSGTFHWDVVAGYYKVRAEKAGCTDPNDAQMAFVETQIYEIPPPVTDIDLRLDCPEPLLTWGDSNCMNGVTPLDALLVVKHAAGLSIGPVSQGIIILCPFLGDGVSIGGSPHMWGDVDCSGAINGADALKILRAAEDLAVPQTVVGCPLLRQGIDLDT